MNRAKKRFYDTYHRLKEQYPNPQSKFLLAALCNCQRRVNELYTVIWNAINKKDLDISYINYLRDVPYQNVEEIEEKIGRMIEIDPKFYSAYAIRGFIKIIDEKKILESISDFNDAVEHIGDKVSASYLLYQMGVYFELIRGEKALSEPYYDMAYKADSCNYRAIYKNAVSCLHKNETDNAIYFFNKILDILRKKKNLPSLQPIECAYLYEANKNIGEINLKQSKYEEAIQYFTEAISCVAVEENMDFYTWMFREQAEIFRKVALEKLQLHKIYDNLGDAYAMINQKEKMVHSVEEYKSIRKLYIH